MRAEPALGPHGRTRAPLSAGIAQPSVPCARGDPRRRSLLGEAVEDTGANLGGGAAGGWAGAAVGTAICPGVGTVIGGVVGGIGGGLLASWGADAATGD